MVSHKYYQSNYSYRGVNKGVYVLLSRTQTGPGRTVKQEQEEFSINNIQTFICLSVRGEVDVRDAILVSRSPSYLNAKLGLGEMALEQKIWTMRSASEQENETRSSPNGRM